VNDKVSNTASDVVVVVVVAVDCDVVVVVAVDCDVVVAAVVLTAVVADDVPLVLTDDPVEIVLVDVIEELSYTRMLQSSNWAICAAAVGTTLRKYAFSDVRCPGGNGHSRWAPNGWPFVWPSADKV